MLSLGFRSESEMYRSVQRCDQRSFCSHGCVFFFSNAFEHIRNWNATAGWFYAFWEAMVFKKDHFPIFSLNHLLYLPYIFRGAARYTERWHLPQNQQSWLGKIVGEAHVDLARKLGPTRHGGEITLCRGSKAFQIELLLK